MNKSSILGDFDPLVFFNIEDKVLDNNKKYVSKKLFDQAGEYVLLKLTENLHDEDVNKILNHHTDSDLFNSLKKLIPNLEIRIKRELENFRKECFVDG